MDGECAGWELVCVKQSQSTDSTALATGKGQQGPHLALCRCMQPSPRLGDNSWFPLRDGACGLGNTERNCLAPKGAYLSQRWDACRAVP